MKEQIVKYCRELRLGSRMSEVYNKIEAIILTTNLEFSKWSTIFYDEKLTAALINRLVHLSYLIAFQGPSYRYQHSSINL